MDIDLATFPVVVGDEPSHLHFESLRRRIWALWHLSAGANPIDFTSSNSDAISNDGRGSTTSWADYIATFGDPAWAEPWDPAHVTYIIYLASGGTNGDLYVNWKEMNRAQALANPPILDGEVNDTWWRRYPDPNKYHHFDRNADRYIVLYDARGSGETARSHTLVEPAWRWLPRHTDPKLQLPPVVYTDTERVVYRYGNKVEVNRKHITQTYSLGAKYDAQTTSSNHGGPRIEPVYGEEVPGNQYANDGGEPGDTVELVEDILPAFTVDEENTTTDKHWTFEAKICAAYQNAIEYLVSISEWVLEADEDYASNYEAYENAGDYDEWDSEESYGIYDIVIADDDRIYRSESSPNEGNYPPEDEVNWTDITVDWAPASGADQHPYALLTDKFWGCNEGAIELLLEKAESFDWYYDRTHPWMWDDLIRARYDESSEGGGGGDEDTMYPPPNGTWRRTWKYGMGRLSAKMRCFEEDTPSGDTWTQTTPATHYSWPGIFNDTDPDPEAITGSYSTTHNYENNLIVRHDPVQINYDEDDGDKPYPQYEIKVACINEMHAVLSLLHYRRATNLTLVMRQQDTWLEDCEEDHDSPQAALDAHTDSITTTDTDYESWYLVPTTPPTNSTVIGMTWEIAYQPGTAKWRLFGTYHRRRVAFKVTGGLTNGLYLANTLWWRLRYQDVYAGDVTNFPWYGWDLDVGIPDEQIITFETIAGSTPTPRPYQYAYMSVEVPEAYSGESEWFELLMLDGWPDDVAHDHSSSDRNSYLRSGYLWNKSFSFGDVLMDIDWSKFPDSVWEQTFTNTIEIAEDPEG